MVYQGPRRGCLNCKRRKRKCDNVLPICGMCFKSNQNCVRHEHALDAILRHESGRYSDQVVTVKQEALSPSRVAQQSLLIRPRPYPDVSSTDAVYFFLQCYAGSATDFESGNGYFGLIQPLFLRAGMNSPLVHATSAIAVWLQEAWSGLFPESDRMRKYLGKALKSVNSALNDPKECIKDETLLAILLLDLHDSLSNMIKSRPASEAHFDGVIALVNHRGALNYKTEVARRLITAVRHQIILYSNTRGFTIDSTAPMWEDSQHLEGISDSKAAELDLLCLTLNSLRATAQSLANTNPSMGELPNLDSKTLSVQLYDAFREVKSLDERFQGWYSSIPASWRPLSVVGAPEFEMYRGSCEAYLDINVAAMLNNYRTSRAMLLKWLIQLSSKGSGFWAQQESLYRNILQQLLDDFCASIPFFLGNKFQADAFDSPRVFYPSLPDSDPDTNRENIRQATAFGGAVMLGNTRALLELTAPDVALGRSLIRAGQREWLTRQLSRVALMYNVRLDPDEFGGAMPPLAADPVTLEYQGKSDVNAVGDGVMIKVL